MNIEEILKASSRDDFLAIADSLPETKKQILSNAVKLALPFADNNIINYGVGALEFVEATAYKVAHRPRKYSELVPVDLSLPEDITSVSYYVYDYTGRGKRIRHNSDVRPVANFEIGKGTYGIEEGGIDYQISYTELLRSAKSFLPIDTTKVTAATEGYQNHLNMTALWGDPDIPGSQGLLNNSTIPTAPSGLVNNDATDSGNVPFDVFAKMSDAVNKVILDTEENCIPDTFLVDSNVYQYLSRTPIDALNTKSILQHFLENNPAKTRGVDLKVIPITNLKDISNPAKTMAMIYKRDSTTLTMPHPMPLRFLPPQAVGTHFNYIGIYTYGPVHFRYRINALYLRGF